MENLLSSALKPDSVALDRVRDKPAPRPQSRTDRAFDRHLDDIDRNRPERRRAADSNPIDRQRDRNQVTNSEEERHTTAPESNRAAENSGRTDTNRKAPVSDDEPQQDPDGTTSPNEATSAETSPDNPEISPTTTVETVSQTPNAKAAMTAATLPITSDLGAAASSETTSPLPGTGADPVFLLEDVAVADGPVDQQESTPLVTADGPGKTSSDENSSETLPATEDQTPLSSDPDNPATASLIDLADDPAAASIAALSSTADTTATRGRTAGNAPVVPSSAGNTLPGNAAAQTPAATGNLPLTPGLTSSLADPASTTSDEPLPPPGQQDGDDTPPRFVDALKTAQGPDRAQIARAALNFANAKPQVETGPPVPSPAAATLDSLFSDTLSSNSLSGGLQGNTGNTLTTLRFTSMARSPQVTNVPVNTLAFHVARQFDNGVNRFQIKLDPPELGRLDVKLEMNSDGGVKVHLTVERPEALDFLQRDSRALEKALSDAGLDTDGNSLSFSLEDHDQQFSGDEDGDAPHSDAPEHLANEDGPAATLMTGFVNANGVDIRI